MYSEIGMEGNNHNIADFLCTPWCCYGKTGDIGLAIDLLDLKAVEFNPRKKQQVEHKFPFIDDSNLKTTIKIILEYLKTKIIGDIKWIVFSGDLSINQQNELTNTVNDIGINIIYYINKFEGLQIYLLSQLYMTYIPFENFCIILDRDTYCIGYLWKIINGQFVKCRELKVYGTGINNYLTFNDLTKLKEYLMKDITCDNIVIEFNGNRIILEKFFDYKILETFLMVGLGQKSLVMLPYSDNNHFKGAIYKLRMLAEDKSINKIYIDNKQIEDNSLIKKSPFVVSCVIC